MNTLKKTIQEIIGDRMKELYFLVVLSCLDSILHMGMFSMMVVTIIELVAGSFTERKLIVYSVFLLLMFILRAFLYAINYTRTQFRGADIAADLRLSLGDHIRSLNLGYFNKNSIGQLMSTLTTDIADFEQMLTHSLSSIFKVIFFGVLALVFAFMISWQCGTIAAVLIIISFPLMTIGGKMSAKYGYRQKSSINNVVSRIVEYINGIKTFKLYNLLGTQFKRLDDSFTELKKDSIKLELSVMPFSISFSIITSLMLPASLIVGTLLLQHNTLDVQGFIAVILVSVSLSSMMATLGSLYPEMSYLEKAAENILKVRNEKPLSYRKKADGFTNYGVKFDHVGFSYDNNVEVLHNVSFVASPGTTTALVGPSGSGKTTIISLISRFWDVQKGSITVGGLDVKELSPDSLTNCMSVVFQDVYLLGDTIANNIRVGKPEASLEEVQAAAKAAQCHDFIMALPDGYNTMVGEGGNTLSGGEKQRISIARALIKDAPIVLLDETTSSLDADNEKEIHRALDMLMKGKTVLVIAHRLNTVVNADQILVLDGGYIKERGTHATLLAQNGWYAQMISEQEKAKKWVIK